MASAPTIPNDCLRRIRRSTNPPKATCIGGMVMLHEPNTALLRKFAYAAAAWAFVFAAMSFYWAVGGLFGVATLGDGMRGLALARYPEMIGITSITGVLRVVAG